jgi:hypothetical protein
MHSPWVSRGLSELGREIIVALAWRNPCVQRRAVRVRLPEVRARGNKAEAVRVRRSAAKALCGAGVPESVVMTQGGWKTAAMFRRYAIVSSADNPPPSKC